MEEKQITVEIKGEKKTCPKGTALLDIAQQYQTDRKIVLAQVDGRLKELFWKPECDCKISFITTNDQEGMAAYRRSMTLLLLKALYHEAGHDQIRRVGIHFSVSSGYYCTVDGNVQIDQSFLDKVSTRMHNMIDQKIPNNKKTIGTDEANVLFGQYGM